MLDAEICSNEIVSAIALDYLLALYEDTGEKSFTFDLEELVNRKELVRKIGLAVSDGEVEISLILDKTDETRVKRKMAADHRTNRKNRSDFLRKFNSRYNDERRYYSGFLDNRDTGFKDWFDMNFKQAFGVGRSEELDKLNETLFDQLPCPFCVAGCGQVASDMENVLCDTCGAVIGICTVTGKSC